MFENLDRCNGRSAPADASMFRPLTAAARLSRLGHSKAPIFGRVALGGESNRLNYDVAATKRVLDLQDGPVVLVGHSYGGSVISIVGTDPKVSRLVYVAALQPDIGETAGQLLSKFPDRNKAAQPAGKGYLRLDPAKFAATFAADVAPAESRFMADSQVPLAASVFSAPTTAAAWHTKPSYAILTTHDLAANPNLQRWEYERSGAKVTTVAASHAVYISHPKIVAHVIEEAAESSTPRTAKKVN